ncbi:AMP-binding protein [Sphingobium sufflavum]|uniref:AMP-binding protein n=1 Tax=Sphingobium sufflavum TaxID=1129547 RepID=UPI001F164662|nr:AMP-binding protein [Sphingobium sufflavum]MCE7798737.1 AMP-binding protein [Sphingobium sufflavum]
MIDPTFAGLLNRPAGFTDRPLLWDDITQAWTSECEIADLSLKLASRLEHGEKRLAFILATNSKATLVGFLALVAAGHAVALIDPGLPEDRLAHLLACYQPDILLGSAPLSSLASTIAGNWVCSDPTVDVPATAIRQGGNEPARLHPDLGLLLLTSGTTGGAKFVRLSWKALVTNARQIAHSLAITSESVGVGHLPFHYSYGLSVVTSHLIAGARVALMIDSLTSESFWAKVKASEGTHFAGVPFHYTVLARLGFDMVPSTVNMFTQAGGGLDARIQAMVLAKVEASQSRFCVMYGQTEAAPRIACLPSELLLDKRGSVGVAMPASAISICGQDGAALPVGQTGHVVYEGPNVMLGYADSRTDLALGDLMKGRLETGDLGWMDEDGFLYLSGRVARFAKIAGLRLSLDDIETQLSLLGSIACVDLGEQIAVVFEGEIPEDAKAQAKTLALASKIPPTSFLVRRLAELPRKSNGKIDYALVKAALDV